MKTFKQYLTEANNITLYRKLDGTKVIIEPDGSYTFWKDGGKTKGAQNRSLKGQQGAVKELMALGYGFGDITDESCKKISEAVLPTSKRELYSKAKIGFNGLKKRLDDILSLVEKGEYRFVSSFLDDVATSCQRMAKAYDDADRMDKAGKMTD